MEADKPNVPPRVRTVTYFVLLAVAILVALAEGLAPIWLDTEAADRVADTAGVILAVAGLAAGGLGVAYRPTRPEAGTDQLGR